jgi:hypothetical protein
MAKQQPFALVYDPAVAVHLAAIEAKYYALIRAGVEEQLRYEPETVTRNRKPLSRLVESGARWELRLGPQNRFRVFYRVNVDQREVHILAIGVKVRDRVLIGGDEVKL